jgi:hypothetical protein
MTRLSRLRLLSISLCCILLLSLPTFFVVVWVPRRAFLLMYHIRTWTATAKWTVWATAAPWLRT